MSKITNAQAAVLIAAVTAPAPKAKAPPLQLAAIPATAGRDFAKGIVGAVVKAESADVSLLETVAKLAASIGVPLSAAQYDKQIRPDLAKAFEAKVKKGLIAETTAASYMSRVKTATLGVLSCKLVPLAGEAFKVFTARAADTLSTATLADGKPVWEGKTGRPAGNGGKASAPGAVVPMRGKQEAETNEPAMLAAALIVTGGNRSRAQKLVAVFPAFAAEFDKWTATILSDEEKTAKRRQTKGSQA